MDKSATNDENRESIISVPNIPPNSLVMTRVVTSSSFQDDPLRVNVLDEFNVFLLNAQVLSHFESYYPQLTVQTSDITVYNLTTKSYMKQLRMLMSSSTLSESIVFSHFKKLKGVHFKRAFFAVALRFIADFSFIENEHSLYNLYAIILLVLHMLPSTEVHNLVNVDLMHKLIKLSKYTSIMAAKATNDYGGRCPKHFAELARVHRLSRVIGVLLSHACLVLASFCSVNLQIICDIKASYDSFLRVRQNSGSLPSNRGDVSESGYETMKIIASVNSLQSYSGADDSIDISVPRNNEPINPNSPVFGSSQTRTQHFSNHVLPNPHEPHTRPTFDTFVEEWSNLGCTLATMYFHRDSVFSPFMNSVVDREVALYINTTRALINTLSYRPFLHTKEQSLQRRLPSSIQQSSLCAKVAEYSKKKEVSSKELYTLDLSIGSSSTSDDSDDATFAHITAMKHTEDADEQNLFSLNYINEYSRTSEKSINRAMSYNRFSARETVELPKTKSALSLPSVEVTDPSIAKLYRVYNLLILESKLTSGAPSQ